jgi:hypothetical protein
MWDEAERTMVNKKKADRSIIWLIPLALTPCFIIGGLWSLSQPWGESWQKILVILFLSVLWLSSIYFENERRLNLNGVMRKKRLQLILALGSALFVICGAIHCYMLSRDNWTHDFRSFWINFGLVC